MLLHGLCENAYVWRLGGDGGFVGGLTRAGFEVWALDIRGNRWSTRPGLLGSLPTEWTFDTHALVDLPAAIEAVRARAGAARVSLVGHSMGGMMTYAYLMRRPDAPVERFVTLGSPVVFESRLAWFMPTAIGAFVGFNRYFPPIRNENCGPAARFGAPLLWFADPPGMGFVWNADNVDRSAKHDMLAYAVGDINHGVLASFSEMRDDGHLRGADGFDYAAPEHLAAIGIPAMVVAGALDAIVPAPMARYAFDHLGSADRRFVLLGRAEGAGADYGHTDLVIGRAVDRDLLPRVIAFLAGR